MPEKKIHVLGGGTVSYVRPHLALTAPAFGETARTLERLCKEHSGCKSEVLLHLTKMASAGASSLETNADVESLFQTLTDDQDTAIIFMNVAMVDYDGVIEDGGVGGKYGSRLKTREQPNPVIQTKRVRKFLPEVRQRRPDIILVAFKTTCNATVEDMRARGLFLLAGANCSFVLVNDTGTRLNLIVGHEGQCGEQSTDRAAALKALVDLALRAHTSARVAEVVTSEVSAGGAAEVVTSEVSGGGPAGVVPSEVSGGGPAGVVTSEVNGGGPAGVVPSEVSGEGPAGVVPSEVSGGGPAGVVPSEGNPVSVRFAAPSVVAGVAGSELRSCTLITGGGRGIGRACAKRMAGAGPVFLVGQTESNLKSVCGEIRQMGGLAEFLQGDVAERGVPVDALARIKQLGWTVRNLVCNAGIGGKGAAVSLDPAKWMRVFDVNVHGSFHFIQACLPTMIEQRQGAICVISSTLGVRGYKYDSAYAASKHAQVGMSRSIAMEVAKHGIVVVPICPAFVDTDMVSKMIENLMRHKGMTAEQARVYLEEKSPQKRIIPPEEVAEAVELVCSGRLRCLNGEPLVLDGGAE